MTDYPVRSQQLTCVCACARARQCAVIAAALLALAVGGCAERKRPAVHWQTAAAVHPRIPASPQRPVSAADEPELEEPAELRLELPAPAPLTISTRPARPRVAPPPVAAVEPNKPQTPFVAPQLSAAESNTAQAETNASLAAAERGIEAARGKVLNAAQTDMASKINGFMNDARAAGATGDWTSAQTLARKAELLAEELARSLP
jgi:hypothetical protein